MAKKKAKREISVEQVLEAERRVANDVQMNLLWYLLQERRGQIEADVLEGR